MPGSVVTSKSVAREACTKAHVWPACVSMAALHFVEHGTQYSTSHWSHANTVTAAATRRTCAQSSPQHGWYWSRFFARKSPRNTRSIIYKTNQLSPSIRLTMTHLFKVCLIRERRDNVAPSNIGVANSTKKWRTRHCKLWSQTERSYDNPKNLHRPDCKKINEKIRVTTAY